jgi:cytoskeletal protein RodZ
MRFSLAVAVVLVGMSLSGWAQQNTFKVKPAPTKAPKSAPIGKTAVSPTASTSASKELQSVERQSAKSPASARSAGPRTGKGPALRPARNQRNPPINFSGAGGGKGARTTTHGSNPYKGRLKEKDR